jgi:hypothetical protein
MDWRSSRQETDKGFVAIAVPLATRQAEAKIIPSSVPQLNCWLC